MGASESTIGEVTTTMAEVSGGLIASGGAVLGTVEYGGELALGGSTGRFRIRTNGEADRGEGNFETLSVVAEDEKRISLNATHGNLHGSWNTDGPFNITSTDHEGRAQLNMYAYTNYNQSTVHLTADDRGFNIFHNGKRTLSASSKTSQLHGQWVMTDVITVSDKRFKRNVRSLLAKRPPPPGPAPPTPDGRGHAPGQSERSPAWLLRQLRPVSYHFHHDSDSKRMHGGDPKLQRFGFVADELQQVVPEVIRNVKFDDQDDIKAVAYQDLIALMVAAQQQQSDEFHKLTGRLSHLEQLVEQLGERLLAQDRRSK